MENEEDCMVLQLKKWNFFFKLGKRFDREIAASESNNNFNNVTQVKNSIYKVVNKLLFARVSYKRSKEDNWFE